MDAADALNDAFVRLVRRARVIASAEAAGWGAAVASVSPVIGAVAAVAIALWRMIHTRRARLVRRADRDIGASNVFVTADELLRGELAVSHHARERVLAEAAERRRDLMRARSVEIAPVWRAAAAAVVCWTVAAVLSTASDRVRVPLRADVSATSRRAAERRSMHMTADVEPPAYTRMPRTSIVDPQELRVVEGSRLRLHSDAAIEIERDGVRVRDAFVASRTGYVTLTSGSDARLIPLVVAADALPVVRVSVPGRDLVLADASPRITFEAHASDDYGLRSLTLEFTKVSGGGEEYRFDAGAIPLDLVKTSAREWIGRATRPLAALGLNDGDMLVYRAVASDEKPGDRLSFSDAFFIEISPLGAAAGDAFTLPEEETRYALSEQMLIVKTDRLNHQRASLPAEAFTDASLNLAVEQRSIRAEFVFMLGGEVEDENVEAQQSIELQAGRLANRGQRDLRDATRAMSLAEKALTGSDPGAALAAERNAVAALQRAFARDRYLLRALASRAQLDPTRRMTGNRAGARELRAPHPNAPENRRAARLQDLLQGIGELARDTPARAAVDRARATVLAASALRIDPDSAEMRRIALDVQRGALDEAAASAAAASRRVLADPSIAVPSVAPGLRRAVDAARMVRR